jgi:hypothetical protein
MAHTLKMPFSLLPVEPAALPELFMEAPDLEGTRTFKRTLDGQSELYLLNAGLNLLARETKQQMRIGVQGGRRHTLVLRTLDRMNHELAIKVRNGPLTPNRLSVSAGAEPNLLTLSEADQSRQLRLTVRSPYREWVRPRTDRSYADSRKRLAISVTLTLEADEDFILDSIEWRDRP